MSLKELSNNLQIEDEFHTFTKKERVIRRPLSLHHLHKDMVDIIRSHRHEEEKKSGSSVRCLMIDALSQVSGVSCQVSYVIFCTFFFCLKKFNKKTY